MTVTTVRVDNDTKKQLDRLQGLIQSETGARVSHSELLRRLVQVARKHESELMAEKGVKWRPPSREEVDVLLRGVQDWGVDSDASKIDEDLYGGSPHE